MVEFRIGALVLVMVLLLMVMLLLPTSSGGLLVGAEAEGASTTAASAATTTIASTTTASSSSSGGGGGTTASEGSWRNQQAKPTEPVRNMACSGVQQIFVMKRIGGGQMVPETPISGTALEICTAETSCCTKEMEAKYREAVQKDFLNIMHTTSSYVKILIAANAARLQENLLDMVRSSANNTYVLFSDVYKRMAFQARDLISQLYGDLTGYLQGREIDLEDSLGGFFDRLFPLVYHHSINPKLRDLSDEYKECMQETQQEIQPFGDLPRKAALHVAKATSAARGLLQALAIGVEVMNATEHAPVTQECADALLRLTYCPHCQGLVAVKSCNGYCINVVRGCLANVAEMDQPWNDYVAALERLVLGMKGVYNVEEALAKLDTRISEAIMHAMENGPEISKKVKRACGQPKRATRQIQPPSTDAEPEATMADGSSSVPSTSSSDSSEPSNPLPLHVRLQTFVKSLSPSKGFYSTLAETLCTDDHLAVRRENDCWNGHAIGEYSKTIVGIGVSAQKYNPEMNASRFIDEKTVKLIEKLKHIRQVLMTRVTSVPDSDTMLNDGSGSGGHNNNNYDDDEDYNDGDAGSGSGYGGHNDYNRKPNKPMKGRKQPNTNSNPSANEDGFTMVDNDYNENTVDKYPTKRRNDQEDTKVKTPGTSGSSKLTVFSATPNAVLLVAVALLKAWLCSSG